MTMKALIVLCSVVLHAGLRSDVADRTDGSDQQRVRPRARRKRSDRRRGYLGSIPWRGGRFTLPCGRLLYSGRRRSRARRSNLGARPPRVRTAYGQNMQPVPHDDVTIHLVQLAPYPFSSRTIAPDVYPRHTARHALRCALRLAALAQGCRFGAPAVATALGAGAARWRSRLQVRGSLALAAAGTSAG